jgi:hypothetical protein
VIGAITAGLYGTGVPPVTNSYESIATVTVGSGGTGTITFSSIPSTFKHLQVRASNQTNRNDDTRESLKLRFNSDTGTNYSYHVLTGNGSSASAQAGATQAFIEVDWTSSSLAGSNFFGAQIIDILDYADTNKYTTSRTLGGNDTNGAGNISLNSGSWRNTAAVSTVTLIPYVGSLFSQYSSFALYGIKG